MEVHTWRQAEMVLLKVTLALWLCLSRGLALSRLPLLLSGSPHIPIREEHLYKWGPTVAPVLGA